jgi:actin related protein 2/3 complex subunit 1A/1B
MPAINVVNMADGVTAHAWSPDRKRIAVCENIEKVFIYKNADKDQKEWVKEHELVGHDLVVSAIDWSPVHNKIVTCSHDRNAFVWSFANNEWKPSLSILRINRAALDVKWSPDGTKFAVASGAKVVPVCHYEKANDWWISKMIKKHKSTVTSVAWHPNSQTLLTGSTDFRARVFSAYISEIEKGVASPFGDTSQVAFGEQIVEFECAGWVEDVAWAPSGDSLCFVGHDSSVSFVSFPSGNPVCQTVKGKDLPNCKCLYLSDDVIVCGGHSFNPEVYQRKGSQWQLVGNIDSKAKNSGIAKAAATNFSAARSLWNNKTTRGQDDNAGADDIWTCHQNAIMDLKAYSDAQQKKITSFSTSALDGRVVIWDSADVQAVVSI